MEYYLWVQKHDDVREQWDLVEKAVDEQVGGESVGEGKGGVVGEQQGKEVKERAKEGDAEQEWVERVREVLQYAREHYTA